MNGFWIFLIIAGVITTFARKEDKARRSRSKGLNNTSEDPKAEIERQLRELFGEEAIPQSVPKPAKSPITTTKTTAPTVARQAGTAHLASKRHIAVAANNQEATKDTSTEKPKIAEIIDDFSMEKAVIYSEILKPKFEEY